MRKRFALLVASCLLVSTADAQSPEFQGLSGGIALAHARVNLDNSSFSEPAFRLELGYRFRVYGFGARDWVTLTPHFSFAFTEVGGIDIGSSTVDFSHVDMGLQLAARVRRVRPYALVRTGKRTIERMEGPDHINYWGSGRGWGAGVEIPVTRTGRGIDVGFTHLSGTFTTRQRLKEEFSASLPYSGWLISLGWSGRFRGTSLLFQ